MSIRSRHLNDAAISYHRIGSSMTERPTVSFTKFAAPKKGSVIVLVPEGAQPSEAAMACDPAGVLPRVFTAAEFKGKFASTVEALAPQGTEYDRLTAIGLGKVDELDRSEEHTSELQS